jgi:2-keto-3-deoxy-6-phosphogluconate aldolase
MDSNDGICPLGPVVFDAAGNLCAAAQFGAINAMGSVFMLTPTQSGYWIETVLHRFDFQFPDGVDGEQPYTGVILNRGKVFGTTAGGRVNDSGAVFEVTPGQ